jgi:hypothetical protein
MYYNDISGRFSSSLVQTIRRTAKVRFFHSLLTQATGGLLSTFKHQEQLFEQTEAHHN